MYNNHKLANDLFKSNKAYTIKKNYFEVHYYNKTSQRLARKDHGFSHLNAFECM